MTQRVSIDDLEFAATWLEAYEGSEECGGDENVAIAQRMATWLRAEAAKREEEMVVRTVVRKTGATPAKVRAKVRETKERM
jgi:hypothetical protein